MNIIHMSIGKIYRYKGVTFEWHDYLGPAMINRHTGNERQFRNVSLRNWSAVSKFSRLTDSDKEAFRLC